MLDASISVIPSTPITFAISWQSMITVVVPSGTTAGHVLQDFAGKIEIKEGPCELSVKPLRDGWQAINLRSIVLKPAN